MTVSAITDSNSAPRSAFGTHSTEGPGPGRPLGKPDPSRADPEPLAEPDPPRADPEPLTEPDPHPAPGTPQTQAYRAP
jgi:hypothetical protein